MREINTNLTFHYTSSSTWFYVCDLHPFYEYSSSVAAVTIAPGPFITGINLTMPEAGNNIYTSMHFIFTVLL